MLYTYLILAAIIVLLFMITISSRTRIIKQYKKYSKIKHSKGLTGQDVVNVLANRENITGLSLAISKSKLSDGYSGKHKTVILSKQVFSGKSVASVAIAAHEMGHALQYKQNNRLFGLWQILTRILSFINRFISPLLIVGITMAVIIKLGIVTTLNISTFYTLIYIAIILFFSNFIVKIVSIPLEYDASKKAIRMLRDYNLINKSETKYVKRILRTAALTYIASLFDGILIFKRKRN